MTHPLLHNLRRSLHRLSPAGIVAAVSGGPDSVALLRALAEIGVQPLLVAHLNHQLRGTDSDADEAFVRQLADSLHLKFHCHRLDVSAQVRQEKGNLESVARRLRYDWLRQVAEQAACQHIATGHTADDQAETVLHRLTRGAGWQGLRGIAACRTLADRNVCPTGPAIQVIRPLLTVRRSEVLAYLESLGQPYRLDQTNLDLARTRNRIRHELLPLLAQEYNPAIVPVLCRLANQADALHRQLAAASRRLLTEVEAPRAGPLLIFDRSKLAAAPRHLIREVFRRAWQREGWPTAKMDFAAWDRLAAVALGELTAVDLPAGLHARATERVVQLGPKT